MFNRIAVLPTAPIPTFLALLFELLLSLGVGKTKEEFYAIMVSEHAVVLLDDTLCNFSSLEPAHVRNNSVALEISTYRANPTSLLTPDGASRQILVETAWKGKKCLAKSCMMLVIVGAGGG
jgi:hypothetical protein